MAAGQVPPWSGNSSGDGTARRTRVAVVITRLEGGAGQLALRGARLTRGAGVEPVVVTGSGDLIEQARAAGLEVVLVPSLRTPIEPRSDLRALRELSALFADGDFDVVHTHTSKAGATGRLAARRAGVGRIVHTYHGFGFHEFQSAARRAAYIEIERRLGRFTDVALCVGTGVAAEAVRRRLIAPERVVTIGIALDPVAAAAADLSARSEQARDQARRLLGLPADAVVVGAVGRLAYQKAPEDFLAALTLLDRPDLTGVWVGGGELADRVERRARKLGTRIVLAGERPDVFTLLPGFDLFALPSRYEGLPTAIVEAMICGVPVIATAVNAVSDLVVPGETGLLVPPGRPADMAGAIGFLLDSPSIATRMATAARASLGHRFTEAALLDALIAAYQP